jgi:hypothetical protein
MVDMAGGRAEVQLLTPDDVVVMVREQVAKAKAKAAQGVEMQGGGIDDEA